MKTCSVEGCNREAKVKGWCTTHYQRWRRYGRLTILTDADRFWLGVNKDGPIHPVCGQCWVWTKADRGHGYGVLSINDKEVATHRFAYTLLVGPIPDGLWVLHRCDYRPCVNPAHLFLGTHRDNEDDKKNKGRGVRGERNIQTRLDPDKAREIKRRLRIGGRVNSLAALARDFHVAPNAISNIRDGLAWAYVDCEEACT